MPIYCLRLLPTTLLALLLAACGGRVTTENLSPAHGADLPGHGTEGLQGLAELPADGLQPWESLEGAGRLATSINANTDFWPGVERFLENGDVADNGEALRLNGTDDTAASWAMYRVPMQGGQPAVVSVDANLLDTGSSYYVATSNYGDGRWDWQGPFSDNHVRLQFATKAGEQFTSTFGNTFVTVLAGSGSSIDIVGIGVNQFDPADTQAPAAPTSLSAVAVAGGIELSWAPVPAADLAGYLIHWSDSAFFSPDSAGVRSLPYLEGTTHQLLQDLSSETFIAVSSVDFSGNRSMGELASAIPLAGEAPELSLATSAVSGGINEVISLSASGAESYDWDLDGDGVYEVTEDSAGTQLADTSATGLVRPRVIGHSDTDRVALGGLSLVVTGNSRPVASATADPQTGLAPLDVAFSGVAEDSEDDLAELEFAWDFDGDGIFEAGTDTLTPPLQSYTAPGSYNAKLRVTDSEGAWDVDTISVLATEGGIKAELTMAESLIGKGEYAIFSGESSTSTSTITKYEWDLDGDLTFELDMGTDPLLKQRFDSIGFLQVALRVTDDLGRTDIDIDTLVVEGWTDPVDIPSTDGGFLSNVAEVDGKPALSYSNLDVERLYYIRAKDWQGIEWNDPVPIGEEGLSTYYSRVAIIDGNPAVAYSGLSDSKLHYVRALDPQGSSWGAPMVVTTEVSESSNRGFTVVDGHPAISYIRNFDSAMMYVRAANPQGSAWSAPAIVNDSNSFGGSDLEVVNGRPCIAVRQKGASSELRWFRANDSVGSTWGSPVLVDDDPAVGLLADVVITAGVPAIFYVQNDATKWVRFCRASNANGSSWETPVQLDNGSGSNSNLGAAIIDGRPAACYRNPALGTMFVHATNALGTAWEAPLVVIPDESQFSHMASVTGRPFVAISGDSGPLKYTSYRP